MYFVKYSWFVAAATLAFFSHHLHFHTHPQSAVLAKARIDGVVLHLLYCAFFLLNHQYRKLSGGDPLDYNKQRKLGGKRFCRDGLWP